MNNLYVTPIYLKDQSQFDKLIQNSLRIDSSINIKEFSIKKLWHHIADGLTVDDNNNEKSSVNFVLVVLGHHRRDHGMTLSDSANGKANSSRKTLSSFLASPPDEVLSSPAYPFSELTAVCICQSKLCLCQPRLCTLSTEERIDCFPISTPTELAEKIDSLKKRYFLFSHFDLRYIALPSTRFICPSTSREQLGLRPYTSSSFRLLLSLNPLSISPSTAGADSLVLLPSLLRLMSMMILDLLCSECSVWIMQMASLAALLRPLHQGIALRMHRVAAISLSGTLLIHIHNFGDRRRSSPEEF